MEGAVCKTCQKVDCNTCSDKYTGKTEVIVVLTIDENFTDYKNLVGVTLSGKRFENANMYNYIKSNYKFIGIGTCKRLNKKIDLWINKSGFIYGTSKVLPYRYFELYPQA